MDVLRQALQATSRKRNSESKIKNFEKALSEIRESKAMKNQWNNYLKKNIYAGDVPWETVFQAAETLCRVVILDESRRVPFSRGFLSKK